MSLDRDKQSLTYNSSESEFAAHVDNIKKSFYPNEQSLVNLLSECHPVYKGKSANSVNRMRGYLMASFETVSLPSIALPYILESLTNSFHPYTVAGAAKAVRGIEIPNSNICPYLIKATYNIWRKDQPISFESYYLTWPLRQYSTAVLEILDTLAWMGPNAISVLPELQRLFSNFSHKLDQRTKSKLLNLIESLEYDFPENITENCCKPIQLNLNDTSFYEKKIDGKIFLEDQDGKKVQWDNFFSRKLVVVAFFYTRCINPRKCSLTIYNLVKLQKKLESTNLRDKIKITAITYDPNYDTSATLKCYGISRGFTFSPDHKFFRIPKDFDKVIESFNLGVNFNGTLVNQHRIEFFLIDRKGEVKKSFLRFQIDIDEIITELTNLINNYSEVNKILSKKSKCRTFLNNLMSIVLPIVIAFFPKCPLCWASYLSILGLTGISSIPYSPWLFPLVVIILVLNLCVLFWRSKNGNGFTPLALSLVGTIFLVTIAFSNGVWKWGFIPGLFLLVGGSMLNSLNYSTYQKLKLYFLEFMGDGFRKTVLKIFLFLRKSIKIPTN
ncbi:MAG: SCO family protein [Bacteroidota bacterium]